MRLREVRDGEGGWPVRIFFWFLRHMAGGVPDPLRVYAYRPGILRGFVRLVRAVRGRGTVPPRLKGLAMYWTARTVACSFWIDLTARLAREAGLTPEELAELPAFRTSPHFAEEERAVLELAEAMTATPAAVSPELFRRLSALFTPAQLVELAAAIALENFSARFNQAFGIEAPPGDPE